MQKKFYIYDLLKKRYISYGDKFKATFLPDSQFAYVLLPYKVENISINTTPDGAELFNTTTSSFPVPIKLTQIYGVSTGVVVITFTIYVEQNTVDAAGNPITEMVPAQNYHSYEVTFE